TLARPHANAKVPCTACHSATPAATSGNDGNAAIVPSSACAGCHGQHPSQRRGHAAALAKGAMTCSTCHVIHRADQGVASPPHTPRVRYARGVEASLGEVAFGPARAATVAIPTLASCRGCHDPSAPADPIARCLLSGQGALGDARPVVCFDEHQPALP